MLKIKIVQVWKIFKITFEIKIRASFIRKTLKINTDIVGDVQSVFQKLPL